LLRDGGCALVANVEVTIQVLEKRMVAVNIDVS